MRTQSMKKWDLCLVTRREKFQFLLEFFEKLFCVPHAVFLCEYLAFSNLSFNVRWKHRKSSALDPLFAHISDLSVGIKMHAIFADIALSA